MFRKLSEARMDTNMAIACFIPNPFSIPPVVTHDRSFDSDGKPRD
jgi:hypothetical protein